MNHNRAVAFIATILFTLTISCADESTRSSNTTTSRNETEITDPSETNAITGWVVVGVSDGDTVIVRWNGRTERIRLIGIDTPERGQCGYAEAKANMEDMVMDKRVDLVEGARNDRDRYNRLLRYVSYKDDSDRTMDAGLQQIIEGYGIARYDSRDGYGEHDREDEYIETDADTAQFQCRTTTTASSTSTTVPPTTRPTRPSTTVAPSPTTTSTTSTGVNYDNCSEVRAAGAAPIHRGDPGYGSHLDRDGDGIGCE